MQPDPLTPQPEEKQPDPSPVQEKKPAKRNIGSIILGIIVILLLMAVAGLGYWAYTLNTDLIATQGELTSLQAEHEQLKTDLASAQSDNEQLTADLNQAKADLEKTNGDLTTAQDDLANSQDQNTSLNNKIDSTSKLVEILYAFSNATSPNDIFTVDTLINDTNNNQLISSWNDFTSAPTDQGAADLLTYLIDIIRAGLK